MSARHRLWLSLESHLGSRDVARVIYGALIGLAVVIAVESHPPPPGRMAAILLGTAVAMGLAELYSEIVGIEARERRRVGRRRMHRLAEESVAVMFGAGFPAIFFLLAAAGVMDEDAAVRLSKWSGLGLIFAYGYIASRLAGMTRPGSLLRAAIVGMIGGALIALKAFLHRGPATNVQSAGFGSPDGVEVG